MSQSHTNTRNAHVWVILHRLLVWYASCVQHGLSSREVMILGQGGRKFVQATVVSMREVEEAWLFGLLLLVNVGRVHNCANEGLYDD